MILTRLHGFIVLLASLLLVNTGKSFENDPTTIIKDGKSKYSIYVESTAPSSVKKAASELQRVFKVSTGVSLPIINNIESYIISLGNNNFARKSIGANEIIPDQGFIIVTKNSNIYILGNDDLDGKEHWMGHKNQWTLLGTYDFLEKIIGVRWLLPTDVGEDIPIHHTVDFETMYYRVTPDFKYRSLLYIKDDLKETNEWKLRNKLSERIRGAGIDRSHSFNSYPNRTILSEHPEYMAMKSNGDRWPIPNGSSIDWKYDLSNKEFIQAFANGIITNFDKNQRLLSASMSPNDGSKWCECPDCKKKFLNVESQWENLGVNKKQRTPIIIEFYNKVAQLVSAKYPDRILGGLIYQDYLIPLGNPVTIEKNIMLGIAVNTGYGFKFYKQERFDQIDHLFEVWSGYTHRLGYTDYSTWMRNWFGVPLPIGKELIKKVIPICKKYKVESIDYAGQEAWGYGAAHNYIIAKVLWNASLNIDSLYNDYLVRAYGPLSAPFIIQMDSIIEYGLKEYIVDTKNSDHETDFALIKTVYGPIWAEIERLYFQAYANLKTEKQKKRLEMLGDNLKIAHFNLWKSGIIEDNEPHSKLYLSDEDFKHFVAGLLNSISVINFTENMRKLHYTELPILTRGWKPN